MKAPDALVVASMRRWIADDFAGPAARRGLPLVHSFGLDVPELNRFDSPAWWTPTEHAARLIRAGVPWPLAAPGPEWLAGLGTEILGRRVYAFTLDNLGDMPRAGWVKPAEMKVAELPARWWDDTADFVAAARAAGLPGTSWVQLSDTRLCLEVEHRAFVCDGTVLAGSPYLLGDGTTWYPGMEARDDLHAAQAQTFAAEVVTALGREQPPAYTLDVGRCSSGQWVVIEGNPVWSSATYGTDMDAALSAVLAAVISEGDRRWMWRPDPHLVAQAARKVPLPYAGRTSRIP